VDEVLEMDSEGNFLEAHTRTAAAAIEEDNIEIQSTDDGAQQDEDAEIQQEVTDTDLASADTMDEAQIQSQIMEVDATEEPLAQREGGSILEDTGEGVDASAPEEPTPQIENGLDDTLDEEAMATDGEPEIVNESAVEQSDEAELSQLNQGEANETPAALDQEEESLFDAPENANADDATTISTIGDYAETGGPNADDATTVSTTVHNENAAEDPAVAAAATHGADGRCGECGEAIGSEDRRTVYKHKAYHPRCFTCYKCKLEKLSGLDGFYVNEGHKYCVDCYNKDVAERCSGCSEAILEGGVRHRSRPYHHKCFKCAACGATLGKTPFVQRDNELLCVVCYADKFAMKCSKCEATIQPGDQFLLVEEKRFHEGCLICAICEDQLADNPFVQDGERNVCVPCSKNGLKSYKLKESAAHAPGPANPAEMAHAAGTENPAEMANAAGLANPVEMANAAGTANPAEANSGEPSDSNCGCAASAGPQQSKNRNSASDSVPARDCCGAKDGIEEKGGEEAAGFSTAGIAAVGAAAVGVAAVATAVGVMATSSNYESNEEEDEAATEYEKIAAVDEKTDD